MTVKTSSAADTLSARLQTALKLPNGARFYRCALQVNPFAYLSRHNKKTAFRTEAEYNAAIIATCLETGTEVIGVTDHYRVHESAGLVQAARAAGIFAFSGFEAVAKDGVHFLCLFDPDREQWCASDLIADTTVPWTVDWLACYEGWLATGRWHGGGRHAPARGEEAA